MRILPFLLHAGPIGDRVRKFGELGEQGTMERPATPPRSAGALGYAYTLIHVALITLVLTAGPIALTAQKVAPASREHIEVIGLHRWTRQMIEDSLAAHFTGPDASLESHACAVNLRKIGFAAAAVQVFLNPGPTSNANRWTLITVVEPQDSTRVRSISHFPDSLADRVEWAGIRDAVGAAAGHAFHPADFVPAAQFYPWYATGHKETALNLLERVGAPSKTAAVYPLLADHASSTDLSEALLSIRTDGNADNRVIAAAILANFPAADSTWWALVRALRDPEEAVGTMAGESLQTLAQVYPRHIDWTGEGDDIRAVFGGTDLWQLGTLIEVLLKTQVSPTLAAVMLRDNAELLASYATSSVPQVSKPARALLERLSGEDLGNDRSAWIAWADSLPPPK